MRVKLLRKGFTLIELLVVLAIIFILAAILFPVFNSAREKAKQATCQSNMKQIALGLAMYVQDYDGRYQAVHGVGYPKYDYGVWVDPLMPYIKNMAILKGPAAPLKAPHGKPLHYSYAMNTSLQLKKQSVIDNPSTLVLNWEHNAPTGYNQGCKRYNSAGKAPAFGPASLSGNRGCTFPAIEGVGSYNSEDASESLYHLGGSNFSFADGHVKWYRPSQISISLDGEKPTFTVDSN